MAGNEIENWLFKLVVEEETIKNEGHPMKPQTPSFEIRS
jgi:hypothetical protein